jgi:Ni,Fe-hydrogenase III large subunit/Ni,Fe-hydrogenase III component G
MTVKRESAAKVTALIQSRLESSCLGVEQPHADTLCIKLDRKAVRDATDALVNQLGARFLITCGTDYRELMQQFTIVHVFSLDIAQMYVLLECAVPEDDTRIDSITGIVPGANWAERESRDVVGVDPTGHPDPRRLLLSDDWPDGVFPLRRDFPYNEKPPAQQGQKPPLREPPPGTCVVPLGPFFPVLEEPAYFRLFVDGETIVDCDYRGFYNHRGIEKLGDSALTYNEIPYVAERICGICGFIHSTCYCQAVEKAAGIEVPRRARYIRTIMLELERIHSHLLWLGIAGHILGFDTVLMQVWRIREPVMWLCEEISGNRKTYGMNTMGGVRRDIKDDVKPKALDALLQMDKELRAVRQAIVGDTTLHARTKGVGILTEEWARKICVVGPPARGSNLPIDARIDHPYAAYDEVPARLVVHPDCDTWARVIVRVDEVFEAIRLVRAALSAMPDGPICAEIEHEVPPDRLGVSVVEAPRGEAIHVVMTGGDNRPYRWRVRAPTYSNLQAVPVMVKGDTIADVPITVGSLDPCFSCTERFEVMDVKSHDVRVYSRAELMGHPLGERSQEKAR